PVHRWARPGSRAAPRPPPAAAAAGPSAPARGTPAAARRTATPRTGPGGPVREKRAGGGATVASLLLGLRVVVVPLRAEPFRHSLAVPVQQVHPAGLGTATYQLIGGLPVLQHGHVLDGHRGGAPGAFTERGRPAGELLVVTADRAVGGQLLQRMRLLGVRRRDHVPLVVLGQCQQPVHRIHLVLGHTDRFADL